MFDKSKPALVGYVESKSHHGAVQAIAQLSMTEDGVLEISADDVKISLPGDQLQNSLHGMNQAHMASKRAGRPV